MNQRDIDRQMRALDDAKITIMALWEKLQARDKMVDDLETQLFELTSKLGGEGNEHVS